MCPLWLQVKPNRHHGASLKRESCACDMVKKTRTLHVKLLLRGLDGPPPSPTALVSVTDSTTTQHTVWQREEDAVILEYIHKNGPKWSNIAGLLPGRTDNSCRNRFHRIKVNMKKFGKIVDARGSCFRSNSRTTKVSKRIDDTSDNTVHSSDGEDEVLLFQPCSVENEYEALPYEALLGVENFHPSDFDYSLGVEQFNYDTWKKYMTFSMRSETSVGDLIDTMEALVSSDTLK